MSWVNLDGCRQIFISDPRSSRWTKSELEKMHTLVVFLDRSVVVAILEELVSRQLERVGLIGRAMSSAGAVGESGSVPRLCHS